MGQLIRPLTYVLWAVSVCVAVSSCSLATTNAGGPDIGGITTTPSPNNTVGALSAQPKDNHDNTVAPPTLFGELVEQSGIETTSPSTSTNSSTSASNDVSSNSKQRPDCVDGCNLVMEGDSLTDGFSGWVCAEFAATSCNNSGIVAHRVDQMIETALDDVDPLVGSGTGDVVILWAGTNDLWQEHYSEDPIANAEAIYDAIITYVDDRRAAGWDIVGIVTLPPLNPDLVNGDEHLNNLIRQNSARADLIIDVGADPKLADPFDDFLRAPDGVHFKDPGRDVTVYGNIVPALKGLGLK